MNVPERSAPHLPEKARSAKSPCAGKAMDLADLIAPDRVIFARATNKQQLLQDLASRSATPVEPRRADNLDCLTGPRGAGFHRARRWFRAPACPRRRARPVFRHVHAPKSANSFRFGRWQSCRSSCFSCLSRRPLAASISPPSLLSPGTCATRNSPRDCAKRQALPHCAAYFAIASIRDLRAAILTIPLRPHKPSNTASITD